MKFECPNCKKVMTIKDEYAGKTGKCPGCGQKITLPVPDKDTPLSDTGPESRKMMEVDSEEFISSMNGETDRPAEAPTAPAPETPSGSRSRKVIPAIVAVVLLAGAGIVYFILGGSTIQIPDISLYNIDADRYVKRSGALPTEAILSWQKAVKGATGEYLTSRQLFFKLPNLDGLWQDDAFSDTASGRYLSRVAAVPLHALRDWRTALRRASDDDVGPELADILLRIIEVDRLFVENEFNTADSDKLIARLNTLSVEDVSRWAEALNTGKGQAALMLVCMDPLFKTEKFDQKRFEKTLKSVSVSRQ